MKSKQYYVTARGSYKSTNGILYLPGDVFPIERLKEGGLEKLIRVGQLCDDQVAATKITGADNVPQAPLPFSEPDSGGNIEDDGKDPVTSETVGIDAEAQAALRENQRLAKEAKVASAEKPEELVKETTIVEAPPLSEEEAHDDGGNVSAIQDEQNEEEERQQMLEAAKGQHLSEEEASKMGLI